MVVKKRGGISIYIIIGVILLLSSLLLITLINTDELQTTTPQVTLTDHEVIYFIDECIKDTTFNGIKQLSLHAGHINPIQDSANPMRSSGVYLSDVFIPYWYYIQDNEFHSKMPVLHRNEGLNSIEHQLDIYVKENLHNCLNNYEVFENQYQIEEGEINVNINVREDDILVNTNYPVNVISLSDNSIASQQNFYSVLDVPLNEVYTFARKINELQFNINFIEQHILNIISLYSGIDKELPPLSDITIGDNSYNYWIRSNVKRIIQEEVLEFIRLIQIMNAKNFNPITYADATGIEDGVTRVSDVKQGIYAAMFYKVDDELYTNVEVDFMYPSTDIHFDINGKELIQPRNRIPIRNFITDMLRLVIYDYAFDYDLTFPVISNLRVRDAYNGEDLNFRFAIQANIRYNIPLNVEYEFEDVAIQPIYDFSDPQTYVYDFVFVKTLDKKNQQRIENVDIYYDCGNEAFIDSTNFLGYVYDFFPYCMFGGKIIAKHEDYATVVYPFNNHNGTDEDIVLEMQPLKEIEVEIRKIELSKIDLFTAPLSPIYDRRNLIYEHSVPLNETNRALITLNKIKEFNQEDDIPMFGFLDINKAGQRDNRQSLINLIETQFENGEITLEEKDQLIADLPEFDFEPIEMDHVFELVPGDYELSIFLMHEENLTIPAKNETICTSVDVFGACIGSTETIEMPEMNFDSFPLGQIEVNVTISEELYNNDKIIFFVFSDQLPQDWDDFEEMSLGEDLTEYNYLLRPYFR